MSIHPGTADTPCGEQPSQPVEAMAALAMKYHYPETAERTHAPDLEGWAINQKPKTSDHRDVKLFRYDRTDLFQWYSRVGASVFEDPFGEPFRIITRVPDDDWRP